MFASKKETEKILDTIEQIIDTNNKLIDIVGDLQDKVNALIQSHPDRNIYNGIYAKLSEKK